MLSQLLCYMQLSTQPKITKCRRSPREFPLLFLPKRACRRKLVPELSGSVCVGVVGSGEVGIGSCLGRRFNSSLNRFQLNKFHSKVEQRSKILN